MPLDNSLNNDLKNSHYHHCAVTAHLPSNDNRRHSMATPQSIEKSIKRIWNNPSAPPDSRRIVHDCLQAIDAMYKVYLAKGSIVPGLSDRNGHRYDPQSTLQHGGPRVKHKKLPIETWLEPHTASAFEDRKSFIKSRYISVLEGNSIEGKSDEVTD